MKDEEIKIEEIESSHTLGGPGSATLLSYTLKYISLSYVGILCQILSVSLKWWRWEVKRRSTVWENKIASV